MDEALTPDNLEEALDFLGRETRIVGGGTDTLVKPALLYGPDAPRRWLFTRRIRELQGIAAGPQGLRIGAAVPLSGIAAHAAVPPLLRQALLAIAAPGIRNSATLAGNVENASPAADGNAALYALDGRIELAAREGRNGTMRRAVAIRDYILGPGRTDRRPGELITAITVPAPYPGFYRFRKLGTRKSNALSKLNLAMACRIEAGAIHSFHLAVGAAAPRIICPEEAGRLLEGLPLRELKGRISQLQGIYADGLAPLDDQRSTARYRRNTALRLIETYLKELADAAD